MREGRPQLPPDMYWRPDSPYVWFSYYDAMGERRQRSAQTSDPKEAAQVLAFVLREVRALKESGLAAKGPLTVGTYAASWIQGRKDRAIDSAEDDETRLAHALAVRLGDVTLGCMVLKEVRPRHLRDLVRALQAKVLKRLRHGAIQEYKFSPRQILHIYGLVRVMFSDAVMDEFVPATPAVLRERRNELPSKVDQDPEWRDGAVYTRDEVELLISDERIAERQRVLHGLEFLCGVRVNEITPRRWRDYDASTGPLGKLLFATAWSRKHKRVKSTKTGVPRPVPVHPTLAKLLARWKLSGWAELYGRPPGPDDLIIPSLPHYQSRRTPEKAAETFMESSTELGKLHEALTLLGFRKRGQHDARATFRTLGQADGGNKEVLASITHTKRSDVQSGYERFPWNVKCEELVKLRIHLREGKLLRLTGSDGEGGGTIGPRHPQTGHPVTLLLRGSQPAGTAMENTCPGRDSNPGDFTAAGGASRARGDSGDSNASADVTAAHGGSSKRHSVTIEEGDE